MITESVAYIDHIVYLTECIIIIFDGVLSLFAQSRKELYASRTVFIKSSDALKRTFYQELKKCSLNCCNQYKQAGEQQSYCTAR